MRKYSNLKAAQDNRLPVLAIDLDGTLLEYAKPPNFGKPIIGMVEELNKLRAAGWLISIWTCRQDSPELRAHLDMYHVSYDYVNEGNWKPVDNSNKIQAEIYLDDKGISFDGKTEGLAEKIMYFVPWHKKVV